MSSTLDVASRVTEIVANYFKRPVDTLDESTRFREDLGADSLNLVELVFLLEQELRMTIPDVATGELLTIGDVVRYARAART